MGEAERRRNGKGELGHRQRIVFDLAPESPDSRGISA
jgi:hypothetical protein